LAEYIQYRKGELTDYLFCSIYGEKLTPNALGHSIRKYNIKRGVGKTSIHLFRHTFAKNWILAGGDIFRLQKLLGHSSMDIVREYVNMFSDDLQKDFDRFNPLEQIVYNGSYIKML
jgi:integrase/recombinase XerD